MNFRDSIYRHLASYKVEVLDLKEKGVFLHGGKSIEKAYILQTHQRELNILAEYREHFFASKFSEIKLHRYFHHLNSSQALCINLFYPLIAEDALALVTQFLGLGPEGSLHPSFEKLSELEQSVRRTNFDFHISSGPKTEIFFEVKYTEDGFASAKTDVEHKDKYRDIYLPLLDASPYLTAICREEEFFLKHYQMLRNLVHLTPTSYVVLLFPSANRRVNREAKNAYDNLLTEDGKKRLKVVFLEDLVTFLETHCPTDALVKYYGVFRRKYLPVSHETT